MSSDEIKLDRLLDIEGIDGETVYERSLNSIVPGICMNDGCDETFDYEPDQGEGWCCV